MSILASDGLPWYFGLRYQDLVDDIFKPSLYFTLMEYHTNWRTK